MNMVMKSAGKLEDFNSNLVMKERETKSCWDIIVKYFRKLVHLYNISHFPQSLTWHADEGTHSELSEQSQ